jgi:DNA-binding HxlR family transcriptional regulator/putative sterol carrier protein
MGVRGGYRQVCPVAHALDLIGERWALLVIRELRLGPRRYVDLQRSLPGIGPSVLSQRLRDLEEIGVVQRRLLPPPAGSRIYELTERGAELEPVFNALAAWGVRSPAMPTTGDLSSDAIVLGLRTFFDTEAEPEQDWTARYELRLPPEVYSANVEQGRLTDLRRAEPPAADVVIETDAQTLLELLSGAETVRGAIASRRLTVSGDAQLAERLFAAVRKPSATR